MDAGGHSSSVLFSHARDSPTRTAAAGGYSVVTSGVKTKGAFMPLKPELPCVTA